MHVHFVHVHNFNIKFICASVPIEIILATADSCNYVITY